MKKCTVILIIFLCLTTVAMPVIADKEGQGVHAGITVAAARTQTTPPGDQGKKQGDDVTAAVTTTTPNTIGVERHETGSATEDDNRTRGRSISDVLEDHIKNHGILNATLRNVSPDQRNRIKNENEVRLAVHTLLEMEGLIGGIGRNVSAIARDFNNSVSSAQTFEDRIQDRNVILRLFFGGDHDAARELANLTAQNQARIGELHQLMTSATLDTEVRAMMDDQVRVMQGEQERLEQLSKREQEDRGFFGWLG